MFPFVKTAKEAVERITGLHVYRHGLPHGTDLVADIEKRYGAKNLKVVFDVGANVGQSALAYAEGFPSAEVYSFEPVSATYHQLCANTRSVPRIRAYQLAMGSATGQSVIHVRDESVKSSLRHQSAESHPETIQVETIADFATLHNLSRIDLLKIDTEGFDLEVLAGAGSALEQGRISLVQTECQILPRSSYFVSLNAVAEYLQRFRYELLGIYEQQPEWGGENILCYCNAVFVSPRLSARGARLN